MSASHVTAALILLLGASPSRTVLGQGAAPQSRVIDSVGPTSASDSDRIWEALRRRGLPLIESLPGTSDSVLVTFVWRGDSSTRNVVVVTPLTLLDFAASVLTRLGQTTVWYRSFVLPTDARLTYRFAPNDNLIPFERDTNLMARLAALRRDPGNPKVFDYGPFGQLSLLELPRAPNDALIHPSTSGQHGAVAQIAVHSRLLDQDRTIWVYTPPGKASAVGRQTPVVVFADGESYQSLIPAPTILDNLIDKGALPPVIAVFVASPGATRDRELNCNPQWSAFLATELIPWIEAHYPTTRVPRKRIVAGYSLGGLAAACAALRYPTVFGGVIAQSGSFFRAPPGEEPEWVARHLARDSRYPIRFALTIGRYETAPIPSRDPSMLTATRHLRDILVAKGYDVDYQEVSSGHEHVAWRAVLGSQLEKMLHADASRPHPADRSDGGPSR